MEFNEIFQHIGDIGYYQALLYVTVGLVNYMSAFQNLGINFIAGNQDHWCKIPRLENFSFDTQRYVAVPYEEDEDGVYDSCKAYDVDFDSLTDSDILNWNRTFLENVTTTDCSAWVYDQSVFVSTINSRFDLVCGRAWMSQFVSTIYMFGMMVASALSGVIPDRVGRYYPMLIGNLGHVGFGLGEAFAPNYAVFVICRFFVPVCTYTAFLSSFVVVMELLGPKYRTVLGIFYQDFFSVGIMVTSGIGYAIRDDRIYLFVISLQVLALFPIIWLSPESPRWLISKGRYKDAEKVLRKVAAVNRKPFPDKIEWTKTEEKHDEKAKVKFSDVCKSGVLCRELGLIYLNWFTTSLVYYGLSLNAGAFGGVYLNNFLNGLIEVPAHLLCMLSMEKGSKRFSNAAALLVAGVFCISCVPVLVFREDLSGLLTALSTIGKGAITFSFACIYMFSAEMFPTPVRQAALGTSSIFARIGSMASPYMGPPMERIWRPLPSLLFGCISIFTGCMVLMLPETRGHKLPDTIEDAEYIGSFNKKKKTIDDKDVVHEIIINANLKTVETDSDAGTESHGVENKAFKITEEKPEEDSSLEDTSEQYTRL